MKKNITLVIISVIFLICSPFMSKMVMNVEMKTPVFWQAIPFWGLGIIAALLLIIFTYSDESKDFFKRNDNKFAGIVLAIPGFAIAALKFKPDSFVSETEYPLYGTMSNFMFGVLGTIFLFSLIKWSAAFFNDKKADKKKWINFSI